MKQQILLLSTLLMLFVSCNTPKNNNTNKTTTDNMKQTDEYHTLTEKDKLSAFVGKKVSFEGKISDMIHQHMMKGMPPNSGEDHQYIDPLEKYSFGQMVVYYKTGKIEWSEDKSKIIRIYGTVREMSGPGKGGGTHQEIYVDADKVE